MSEKEEFQEVKLREFRSKFYMYASIFVCFSWSIYQLYLAYFPQNTTIARAIHLAFAIGLVYMFYPINKKISTKIPFYDWIFLILSVVCVLYPAYMFNYLATRPGDYLQIDIIVGAVGSILLLEAGRRVIGPALGGIGIIFLIYSYVGHGSFIPEIIEHQGSSIYKLVGHMFLTTNGIFGVPISVSTNYIFLFVLFGSLLDKAGAGKYFIDLAFSFLGQFRGGPAKASVIASGLTGMVSGSSTANVVTVGTFTIPLMKKAGLTSVKAGAIEVAAGVNGQLMPPIMGAAAFIIAEFLGMSYNHIMLAAVIPAFVCYASLFFIVHLESVKLGLKGLEKVKMSERLKIFLSGIHYMIPIIVLLYTLLVLKQSAISGAFNAISVLFLIILVQHPIRRLAQKQALHVEDFIQGFNDIFWALVTASKNMVPVAIATALAGIIIGSISLTGVGQVLSELVEQIAGNQILLILALTAVMSLILGMGLPTTANYIVVSSLIAPVILTLAHKNGFLVPAIAVHLFTFYFGILADDTPPVGIAAYASAGIAKANPVTVGVQGFIYDLRTAILPFAFFFNNKLLLIQSVNEQDPLDIKGIVWISNPVDIAVIFFTALIGMFAFSSILQGYFVTKLSAIERILLIPVVPLTLVPNICAKYSFIPNEYSSYILGLGLYIFVFLTQFIRNKHVKKQANLA